jgi:membrane protease YdiL (CAAX protease family)
MTGHSDSEKKWLPRLKSITPRSKPVLSGQKTGFDTHPILVICYVLLIYIASQIAAVASIIYPLIRGLEVGDWLAESPLASLIAGCLIQLSTILIIWMLLWEQRLPWRTLGLVRPKVINLVHGLAGYAAYLPIYFGVAILVQLIAPGVDNGKSQDVGFGTDLGLSGLAMAFITLVVLAPIGEEILFRGYMYGALKERTQKWMAAIVTSLVFGAAHLQFGDLLWMAALDTFILSLALIYLREKTNSLWPSILLHMIKNFVAFMAIFVYKVSN